jgi:nitroreductase
MILDLLQNRFTAKWWQDQPISASDLATILKSVFLAPSKQSKYNYKIYMFTDSVEGKKLKEWFYWENTACLDKIRGKSGEGLRRYNGQVLAPIYLLWVADNENLETRDDCMVSATVTMLAAEELGLQTGFCGCIGPNEIKEKLNISGTAVVSLGIGHAIPDTKESRKVFKQGKEMGFDLSNTLPALKNYHVRKNKPSFDNLIKIV